MAGVSARRLMFEALIVAAAIGGALLLRERGLAAVERGDRRLGRGPADRGRAGARRDRGRDPRRPAVPDPARRRSPGSPRGGRGLVPMLAARRAREGGAASAVLLVLLATATVGAFAADGARPPRSRRGGRRVAGGRRVVADPAAERRAADRAWTRRRCPGVEVGLERVPGPRPGVDAPGPSRSSSSRRRRTSRRSSPGRPIEPAFPAGFATPAPGPIPAIVSRSLVESPRGVKPGETFTMSIEGYNLTYRGRRGPRLVPGRAARVATSSSSPARRSSARRRPPASSRSTRCSARRTTPAPAIRDGRRGAGADGRGDRPGRDARTSSGPSR